MCSKNIFQHSHKKTSWWNLWLWILRMIMNHARMLICYSFFMQTQSYFVQWLLLSYILECNTTYESKCSIYYRPFIKLLYWTCQWSVKQKTKQHCHIQSTILSDRTSICMVCAFMCVFLTMYSLLTMYYCTFFIHISAKNKILAPLMWDDHIAHHI